MREDRPAITMRDHFASGLARTGDVQRAAATLGQSAAWGKARFKELCEHLDIPVDPRDDVSCVNGDCRHPSAR